MPKQRAYVYKDTFGFDEYRVYPPVVVLTQGDTFELVNATEDEATLEVPASAFGAAIHQSIQKGKKSGEKSPGGQDARAVEYKVFVKGHRAKANSDPVIIIDL